MRYAFAAVILVTLSVGVYAQETPDATLGGFRDIPCRYYSNPKADPTGDIVDLLPEIRSSLTKYVATRSGLVSYPSECNVNATIEAECRLTPKATIGAAVDSLYAKVKSGRPLPRTRACGA